MVNWAQGSAQAPVTVVEYGSLTCGHCANFNTAIKPTIKQNYVDTGRVRFIFRPFPTPPNDLSVAMHVLSMCGGASTYYPMVDAYFAHQEEIFEAARGETGPRNILFAIAEDVANISSSQAETCLRDPQLRSRVLASYQAGANAGVISTPTLFVNGVRFEPNAGVGISVASFSSALDAALRARTAPRVAPKSKAAPKRATAKGTGQRGR
jgi:protein-disulfide isomerase